MRGFCCAFAEQIAWFPELLVNAELETEMEVDLGFYRGFRRVDLWLEPIRNRYPNRPIIECN